MQIDVLLVLNERELLKERVSKDLQRELSREGLTVQRATITDTLLDTVLKINPSLLVIDYLLGDMGTGIDILEGLCEQIPLESRPKVVFLTDEPSIRVAVEAMQKGAVNFLPLSDSSEVLRMARAILSKKLHASAPLPRFSKQSWESKGVRDLRTKVDTIKANPPKSILITGREGSGKKTLARELVQSWRDLGEFRTINLKTSIEPLARLLGLTEMGLPKLDRIPAVGRDFGALILYPEEDLTQLIPLARSALTSPTTAVGLPFVIATADPLATEKLITALSPTVLTIPPLSERQEDIPHIAINVQAHYFPRMPPLDPLLIDWLSSQYFPGELQELTDIVVSACAHAARSGIPLALGNLEEGKRRWEERSLESKNFELPDPLTLARMIEKSNHQIRPLARFLGGSPSQIREALEKKGILL